MANEPAHYDVLIVGCGCAGLSAALAAVESAIEAMDEDVTLAVFERASKEDRGGSTRFTGAFLRVNEDFSVADTFIQDMLEFSGGRSNRDVVERLAAEAQGTLTWVQGHGVSFDAIPTGFLTSRRPRLLPVGGGRAIVDVLAQRVEEYGVPIVYNTAVLGFDIDVDGGYTVRVQDTSSGAVRKVTCRALVLASGGFEGNEEMLIRYLGPKGLGLPNISPGGLQNRGEGIRSALAAGASGSGDFSSFHAEPIDPRSRTPEPAMFVFPYALLINQRGKRFTDEGAETVDEQYERVARMILQEQDGLVYIVSDQKLFRIPGWQRAVMTDQPPYQGDTLEALAQTLGIDSESFVSTVREYNAAVKDAPFDHSKRDGKSADGLAIPKSNWAQRVDEPPYVAYPMACSIVFTFGGIQTNANAEVVSGDGLALPGLYAAGELTGLYYGKYPGATSVLRGLVFGRVAGDRAIRYVGAGRRSEA